jgi:alpha-glucosidase
MLIQALTIKRRGLLLITLCTFVIGACAQKQIKLSSPDGKVSFEYHAGETCCVYDVSYEGKKLIANSGILLTFKDGPLKNAKTLKPVFRDGVEEYSLIVGKTSRVREEFREVTIPIKEGEAPHRLINIIVRAFDDAIAFRYEFPKQKGWTSLELADEHTSFRMTGNPEVLTLFLPNFTSSHEGLYTRIPLTDIEDDTLMDLPALFMFPENIYLAITEAALVDYAGMYLVKKDGVLQSDFATLPGNRNLIAEAALPHKSPWRVIMIGNRAGDLIESNILTNLNDPLKLKDVSWVKPGTTTWPWWNGNVISDSSFVHGNNFETNKYYIDFCARNGIDSHSIVEHGQHEWYVNDGKDFQPGPNVDVTRPVPGLDMQRVCDYAREKGVGIRVWVHWAALYPKLDAALDQFEKWGIQGMMVDFMDRDDQEMVNIQQEILTKSAAHKIHIQFHGAYKPTGLHRTFPNEFTREGTLNYEVNKWGMITPDHDINIPFTRMLAGSTDYHLGGFRAVRESDFQTQYTAPVMLGTRAHMLAMYVVLENYLGMMCDFPDAYEGQPGFDFLKRVPTIWDETKVLTEKVGEFIVIARRKNSDWYVGGITNHASRSVTIPLDFLGEGSFEAEIFSDADDADKDPNHIVREDLPVDRSKTISVNLSSGGGFAIHLKKIVK